MITMNFVVVAIGVALIAGANMAAGLGTIPIWSGFLGSFIGGAMVGYGAAQ